MFALDNQEAIEATGALLNEELNVSMNDFIALLAHVANQFQEMAAIFELPMQNSDQIKSITELASVVLLNEH